MDCNKFILLLLISPLFAETFEKKFCKVFRIVFTLFFFLFLLISPLVVLGLRHDCSSGKLQKVLEGTMFEIEKKFWYPKPLPYIVSTYI